MRSWIALPVVAAALLSACSPPPADKLAIVRKAVAKAESVEAEVYAPEEWVVANDAWTAAEEELARQTARFSLFRSYGDTGKLLDDALAGADKAYGEAVERRRAMTN